MSFFSLMRRVLRDDSTPRKQPARRLLLEALEDRTVPSTTTITSSAYGQLPLAFQANSGQAASGVDYVAQGGGYTVSLSSQQALVALANGSKGNAVSLQLVGSNALAHAVAQDPQSGTSNYLVGNNSSKWLTNIANYGQVTYQNVYNGIDETYSGNQGQLDYTFTVAAGADPGRITMSIQGAKGLSLDSQGNLVIHTSGGNITEDAPVIYQVINGVQQSVSGSYVLEGHNQVGFQIGAYDPSQALVIDPTLSYSTYFGPAATSINAIAVDSSGNAYVTGSTDASFPTTAGAFMPTGNYVFVAKLNATGAGLVYATYLSSTGGGPYSAGNGIAVDSAGEAYVIGVGSVPTTANALAAQQSQGEFFAVLNSTGTGLLYSTALPNTATYSTTMARGAIAIDSSGNAYLTGAALSGFPTTAGAFQSVYTGSGNPNAYFAQIDPHLSGAASLLYSTYLGVGQGSGVAVDGSGNAYVTGWTTSSSFPTTAGALQQSYSGSNDDAFVAKIDPNLSGAASLVYSTYLGGNGWDGYIYENTNATYGVEPGPAIAVDSSGDAYVTGSTDSTNFPTTPGAFQTTYQGGSTSYFPGAGDVYVAKLNPTGTALIYSTYLGGSARDGGSSIAIDSAGDAYVTGWTWSSNFPTMHAIQASQTPGTSNNADAFVTVLNPAGNGLVFSTYLGGTASGEVFGNGIAVDSAGNIYVAGDNGSISHTSQTSSFPTTGGAYQTTPGGGFITKINSVVGPSFTITGTPSLTAGTSGAWTITALNADGTTNTNYSGTVTLTSSDPKAILPASVTFSDGTATFSATLETAGSQSITATDANNAQMTGADSGITVTPAAASTLSISAPAKVSSGKSFSLTVTALDPYGNVATGYTGTVHFSSSDSTAILPANYTFTASDVGVHTFTATLKKKGAQTLTATDTSNDGVTGSASISVG